MAEHYDVIIIGTGAGGGTLAHRLAPVRQAHPAARARRLPAARARELGLPRGLRQGALPVTASSGSTRTAQRVPARTSSTSSAATRSSTARSCSGCASATSARSATTAGVSPAWPLVLRGPRALLRRGRAALPRPRRRRGEDPTEPPRSGPVPVPGGLARAAHPAARTTTSQRTGHQPVPPAGRRRPRRDATPRRAAACAATASTASPA